MYGTDLLKDYFQFPANFHSLKMLAKQITSVRINYQPKNFNPIKSNWTFTKYFTNLASASQEELPFPKNHKQINLPIPEIQHSRNNCQIYALTLLKLIC